MRRRGPQHAQHAPPWWPANEPWPPQGRSHGRWRGRSRFIRRVAVAFAVLLLLSAYGASTLVFSLLGWTSRATAPPIGWVLLLAGLSLALLAVVFLLAMRRVGLPMGDVIGASERVSAGDFSVRLAEHGPPSLRSVARAFNSMATHLEENEQRRRQFMADVAHELRTPLAIIQGRLEGITEGIYQPSDDQIKALAAETRTIARLVDDLRSLANAETGELSLEKEPTDLAVLLHEAASAFAGYAGVEVKVDAGQLPSIEVDPVRIKEVVTNLLSNAVRYAPAGSVVTLRGSITGDRVSIAVLDEGPGIAADRLAHVFDRFHKDRESTGSGLGLYIARSVARAHGGDILAESRLGAGTTMTVSLPRG